MKELPEQTSSASTPVIGGDIIARLDKNTKGEESENETREVVSLEDGTKVVRVRRRKRKHDHETFKKVERRWAMPAFFLFLVLLFVGLLSAVGFVYYKVTKMATLEYKTQLEKEWASEWGATAVEVGAVSATPFELVARDIKVQFPASSALSKVEISYANAKINPISFFTARYWGDSLSLGASSVRLNLSSSQFKPLNIQDPVKAFGSSFARVQCSSLQVDVYQDERLILQGHKMEADLQVKEDASLLMYLNSGDMSLGALPKASLDSGLVKVKNGAIELFDTKFKNEKTSGQWFLRGSYKEQQNLKKLFRMEAQLMPLSQVIGDRLALLFSGLISFEETNVSFGESPLNFPFYKIEGKVQSLFIRRFSFLGCLSQMYASETYRTKAQFISVHPLEIVSNEEGVSLVNIDIKESNLMALSGELTLGTADKIVGKLEVGVPDNLALRDEITEVHPIFKRESGSYYWFPVTISGKVSEPLDGSLDDYKKAEAVRLEKKSLQKRSFSNNKELISSPEPSPSPASSSPASEIQSSFLELTQ